MRIERHVRPCLALEAKLTEPQGAPNVGRPLPDIQAVFPEERDGQTVHAKRDTTRVRDGAVVVTQIPGRSEIVKMVIKAHASGRLVGRVRRDEQLEFQRLLELADRHYLAGSAEERVACRRHLV